MASQQQLSNTPLSLRDRLETPQWLWNFANDLFSFKLDLASSEVNAKCDFFYDQNDNSLEQDWSQDVDGYGWCNPPYSEPKLWLKKAWEEAQLGFNSVFLIPTPNGEDQYREYVFGKASEIIYINGRISFISPDDFFIKGKNGRPDKHVKKGDEMKGNTRGSCLVVFNRRYQGPTLMSWVDRDVIRSTYEQ